VRQIQGGKVKMYWHTSNWSQQSRWRAWG